jgi:hypothetical protein
MAQECSELLKSFFASRRLAAAEKKRLALISAFDIST